MFCKECGAEIPDGSKHCSECGAKLVNDSVNVDKDVVKKESFVRKNKKAFIGCCVGLFVIFIIIAGIAVMGDHSSSNNNHKDDGMSEEDFKNNCTVLEFNKVNKNPDNFKGEKFKCTGKIIQIMEDSNGGKMRLALGDYYSDVVYVTYEGNNDFVEDDYVTVYGYCDGGYSYTSTVGASVDLPKISAKYIEKA